ncbi:MAG: glycosyltransferase family 2 protein [Myxococcales bacterium]|nr:glycosyltransferase family 2 protein [Myxococcales bacterium]
MAALTAVALGLLAFTELGHGRTGLGLRGALFPYLGTIVLGLTGVRALLWLFYRPRVAPAGAELPRLTVVIPAYNEGPRVRRAVTSVLASDYPRDRLRVIAVNDGSKDDTGAHLDAVAREHGDRVNVVHLAANRGKRHAVYTGFKGATEAEVVATVDSDSRVLPDTLRRLVAPFLADARVAGVAGKVLVDNREQNTLTRMLGVRYILGFDFIRAYQSLLGTVWCCPGALQAYRREVIAPHLERWRDQRFLGKQCTNGDDHAMTNLVLSLGWDTAYQADARVLTVVPAGYRKLTRMFTRWGRSATREGLRALAFAPRRAVAKGWWRGPLVLLDAVLQPVTILAKLVGFAGAIWVMVAHPLWFLRAALWTTVVAVIYGLVYLRSERSTDALYGVLYAWFALFGLFWVQPWATVTVRGNRWLTR